MIEQVVDDLHNSSLILDDIQDESPLRRGSTSTHLVFGNAQAINSAVYMFVRASKQMHAVQNLNLMAVFLEELENLLIGQSWDLKWKFTMQCPTVDEYLAMVDLKTGAMFKMVLRLMQTATKEELGSTVNFGPLARLLGRWYQIRDDYMNLKGTQYTQEKGFCEDLDEGKFSYPIVRCCGLDLTAREIIMHTFQGKQSTLAPESKIRILNLMQEAGALQETHDLVISMQKQIEDEIGRLEVHFGERNTVLRLLMKLLGDVPAPTKCPESSSRIQTRLADTETGEDQKIYGIPR
jgi:geranylgeranyl pyrophosphate synthase